MISVAEALENLFNLVSPLESEIVPLRAAHGRVLAADAVAQRTQPPFAASAMDGYALRQAEAEPDAMFKVVGEA
ncbi:MAG: molybdopterin molybdenumtransferase MoeA, partial [Roseobacter sp.]